MAKPSKEKAPVKTWFFDYIRNLVNTTSSNPSESSKNAVIKKMQDEFGGDQNKKDFLDLLAKHGSFFDNEQELDHIGSLPIAKFSNLTESGETNNTLAGKIVISGRSINTWVDMNLSEQGVTFSASNSVLDDLLNLGKKIDDLNNQDPITSTVLSLPHIEIYINIPDHVVVNNAFIIEYDDLPGGAFLPVRLNIHMEPSSSAKIVVDIKNNSEEKQSSIIFQANKISLEQNAELFLFRNQNCGETTAFFTNESLTQERDSHAEIFSWDNGGALVDTTFTAALAGIGSESIITGVYNPLNGQKYFYDTEQRHLASNTVSDLLYKGVIGKNAFTFWKGNIIVEPKTKGTNGYQANKNLIIDETAKVESIPGLEIITDDVRCSHGVTIGNIDRNHMFYLQSRGINKREAEELIINGFLSSAKNRIKNHDFLKIVSSYFTK